MIDYSQLINNAISARENAYAPYSGYKVGACLIAENGALYKGCNVENASYGATVCAERVAFASAVANGERKLCAIAIVGGKDEITDFAYPCGICLQVMSELCRKDFEIVLFDGTDYRVFRLGELLPKGFKL